MMKTFDINNVVATFLGNELSGFADGTAITIDRNEDTFTLVVGADGETARSRSNNRSGTISFTFLASSASNDILSAAAAADEATGQGVGPFFLKELNGGTTVVAPNAWVKKPASLEFAKEIGSREWTLECDYLEVHVGGLTEGA